MYEMIMPIWRERMGTILFEAARDTATFVVIEGTNRKIRGQFPQPTQQTLRRDAYFFSPKKEIGADIRAKKTTPLPLKFTR